MHGIFLYRHDCKSVAGEGDSTGLDSDTILVRVDVGISAVKETSQ